MHYPVGKIAPEEIGDAAQKNPVDQVAQRSPQDECVGDRFGLYRRFFDEDEKHDDSETGNSDKDDFIQVRLAKGKAESRSRIADIGDPEDFRRDANYLAIVEICANEIFTDLIEQDDEKRNP